MENSKEVIKEGFWKKLIGDDKVEIECNGKEYHVFLNTIPEGDFFEVQQHETGEKFNIRNPNYISTSAKNAPVVNESNFSSSSSEGSGVPSSDVLETNNASSLNNKNAHVSEKLSWCHSRTQLLISLYAAHEKTIMQKKNLYEQIRVDMRLCGYEVSTDAIESKWKSLLRAYKNACVNEGPEKSGRGAKPYNFSIGH